MAAGNEGQDACNVSPASAEKVITVGATDKDDEFAYFSNYGSCEDISGPVSENLDLLLYVQQMSTALSIKCENDSTWNINDSLF